MRILLVSTSSGSRGGGELWLLYLARGLKDNGHEVALWTSSHKSMDELCQKFDGVGSVLRSNYKNTYQRKLRLLSIETDRLKLIQKQWESWQPDILHLNKQNLEDGLDLLYLADATYIPSVCMIHITQSARYLKAKLGWLRDWFASHKLRQYGGTFVTTPSNRAITLREFLKSQKPIIKVINNAVPKLNHDEIKTLRVAYRQRLNLDRDQLLFVTVGRLVSQKRPFYFLEAAQAILQFLPNARFIWVGDGSLKAQWDYHIKQRRLASDQIQCLGWQDDVMPWLAAADLYIHTAQYEGLPFSVLEALSLNLPCLITENLLEEIPEFKAPGILPLESSISQIHDLVQDHSLKQLQQNASKLFESKFSLPIMIQQYEDLYKSCLTSTLS